MKKMKTENTTRRKQEEPELKKNKFEGLIQWKPTRRSATPTWVRFAYDPFPYRNSEKQEESELKKNKFEEDGLKDWSDENLFKDLRHQPEYDLPKICSHIGTRKNRSDGRFRGYKLNPDIMERKKHSERFSETTDKVPWWKVMGKRETHSPEKNHGRRRGEGKPNQAYGCAGKEEKPGRGKLWVSHWIERKEATPSWNNNW